MSIKSLAKTCFNSNTSFDTGCRAGAYALNKKRTMEDYLGIRWACHAQIRRGLFDIDAFNRGYNETTGWPYDFHQEFGDLFQIGWAFNTKEVPQALPPRKPLVPYAICMK